MVGIGHTLCRVVVYAIAGAVKDAQLLESRHAGRKVRLGGIDIVVCIGAEHRADDSKDYDSEDDDDRDGRSLVRKKPAERLAGIRIVGILAAVSLFMPFRAQSEELSILVLGHVLCHCRCLRFHGYLPPAIRILGSMIT